MKLPTMLAFAALALAACSGPSDTASTAEPVALVKLAKATTGDVETALTLYGAVEQGAAAQYTLSAPMEASIVRIAAPVGSTVARGQLIVMMSPSPTAQSIVTQARSGAQAAEQAYQRAVRLRTDGLVSDAEVESARLAAVVAKSGMAALSTQAGQLALRAPFASFVETIASNPGELVAPGTTVVTLARSGDMRARFNLDHSLIGRITRGEGVRVTLPSEDIDVNLPIAAIDPTVNPQTRQASIFVNVPAAYGLGSGQPLRGEIILESAEKGAVTVPYAAILDDGGQPFVFVVSQGMAHRKDVQLGAGDGTTISVSNGIKEGDQVVVEGGTALEDGMKVRTQ